jgi:hypothetical protein
MAMCSLFDPITSVTTFQNHVYSAVTITMIQKNFIVTFNLYSLFEH